MSSRERREGGDTAGDREGRREGGSHPVGCEPRPVCGVFPQETFLLVPRMPHFLVSQT